MLHDRGRNVWTSFTFRFCVQYRACAAFGLLRLEKPGSSEELLECSTRQTFLSFHTEDSEHQSLFPCNIAFLIHNTGVRPFMYAFHSVAEKNSQTVAPTFVNGKFKGFRFLLIALSHCGYRGKVPSPRSHPLPCPHPRQSMNFSRLPFLQRTVELLVVLAPCFARLRPTERRLLLSVSVSFTLRLCSGLNTFVVTPLPLFASSHSSLLYFKSLDTGA